MTIESETVPSRRKWDLSYQERQKTVVPLKSTKTNHKGKKWTERPLNQRENYKDKKRINSAYCRIQQLEDELAQLKGNISDDMGVNAAILTSRAEKERFLIEEVTLDDNYIKALSDHLVNLKYLEMTERMQILYAKGLSHNDIITVLTAESLVAAGKMAGGAGFYGIEHCVAEKAREVIFSPEEMVRITVETSCNLSNINEVAKCQSTLQQGEVGFMYKKTTITQAGLDAMEGKNDEMIQLYYLIKILLKF